MYDLDDVAHGGPEHADFWLQAVQKKLSGKEEFSYDFDQLLHGYDVGLVSPIPWIPDHSSQPWVCSYDDGLLGDLIYTGRPEHPLRSFRS